MKPIYRENDFRYKRFRLPAAAFAIRDGEYKELDRIDPETWGRLLTLPDDVAIRTGGNCGGFLKVMDDLHWSWLPEAEYGSGPVRDVLLDCFDEFQACIFNALCGYYRVAIGCLRGVVELSAVAAFFELGIKSGALKQSDFDDWYTGEGPDLKFGNACDKLAALPEVKLIEEPMKDRLGGRAIFDQKTKAHRGGWARFTYSELSNVAHNRPHVSSNRYWGGSNGPVFSVGSFQEVYAQYLSAMALSRVLLTIGKSSLPVMPNIELLLTAPGVQPSTFACVAFNVLWSV